MKYKNLKHFERVHGKGFVFLLERLDKMLEGEDERFFQKKVQFEQPAEQSRQAPRPAERIGPSAAGRNGED